MSTSTQQGEKGRRSRRTLAAAMLGVGVTHFVVPGNYEKIVPRWAGDARQAVLLSGVAELVCGALLLNRRTSRLGGRLTALLMVAVFPANVQMLLDAGTEHQAYDMPADRFRVIAAARLPFQVPMLIWALRVANRSGKASS